MASRREIIRKKFGELLKGKTAVADRVFTNPSSPTWAEHLPVILVRTLSESTEKYTETPREYKRELQVLLEIIVQGQESGLCPDDCERYVEDKLDQIAHEIECALFADDRLGCINDASGKQIALVDDLMPLSAEFDFVAEGEKPIGSARLIFQATYFELLPASLDKQPGIADFKTADIDYKVGHHDSDPDEQIEANDFVAIPQT